MTKKEKKIYNFCKKYMPEYHLSIFDTSIYNFIGGAFPEAKIKNVLNVVYELMEDDIDSTKNKEK